MDFLLHGVASRFIVHGDRRPTKGMIRSTMIVFFLLPGTSTFTLTGSTKMDEMKGCKVPSYRGGGLSRPSRLSLFTSRVPFFDWAEIGEKRSWPRKEAEPGIRRF